MFRFGRARQDADTLGAASLAARLDPLHGADPAQVIANSDAAIAGADLEGFIQDSKLEEDKLDTLADLLVEINGTDCYSELSQSQAEVPRANMMAIPLLADEAYPVVTPQTVGAAQTKSAMRVGLLAQVYALNKARAPNAEVAVRFAALRTAAFAAGYYAGQHDVVKLAPLPDALQTYVNDMVTDSNAFRLADELGFLVPLFAEFVFRTRGHHYITGQAEAYNAVYTRLANSALISAPHTYLSPEFVYHLALHWVTPARARAVLLAQKTSPSIPDALKLRANAAPAGSAIIATSAAVLEMLPNQAMANAVFENLGLNKDEFYAVVTAIKSNPASYHKAYYAYGVARPDQASLEAFDNAHKAGERMAPVLQGFIDVALSRADMSQAMALRKHATSNPVLMKKAATYFRAYLRQKVGKFDDIFSSTVDKPRADETEEEETKA